MLKVTPYLGALVVIVSLGGIWYPKLGYFLLLVFGTLMAVSPFRGRWFCGNLCPRGSFNDFWLGKASLKRRIPTFLSSMWLRVPLFLAMMGFMGWRIIGSDGLVDRIGMVFVTMCIATTSAAILLGLLISPRAWCTLCPMGTLQRVFGGGKMAVNVDLGKCTRCGACHRVCPMQFPVNEMPYKPDCIKCARCVSICRVKALSFQ